MRKHLKEYLKSSGFEKAQLQGDPEGALNNVLDRAIDWTVADWTRRQSPLKDKPAHGRVERFHATLEGLMRTWRNDAEWKRYGVSLPPHNPTVARLVRHCAWLHDRFVMKRQDQQTPFQRQMARDYPVSSSSPFLRQCFGENQDLMCSSSKKSGVSASGQDATTWPTCTTF